MESDVRVAGPDAPIANSKTVNPDLRLRTEIGQLLVCPSSGRNDVTLLFGNLVGYSFRVHCRDDGRDQLLGQLAPGGYHRPAKKLLAEGAEK